MTRGDPALTIVGTATLNRKEPAMDDRNAIGRRIIDRAVDLFGRENPNDGGGLFTTAHYGQAVKAEFRTPGPTLDGATCAEHLEAMDGVERAGSNMWRRVARSGAPARSNSDITETTTGVGDTLRLEVEDGVMRLLSGEAVRAAGSRGATWWSIETMAAALEGWGLAGDLPGNVVLLENLVGLSLYTMAVDGRAVSQRNILLEGERRTVFALAAAPSDLRNPR